MRNFKKLLPMVLALPVIGFAASAPISDWGFEPNGDVRAVVNNETVFVSPENETEYFQTLMAARLQWPVEAAQGHLVIDIQNVPEDQQALLGLSMCGETKVCDKYTNLSINGYACVLDKLEASIVAAKGTYDPNTWPQPVYGTGAAIFKLPASAAIYAGNYQINVTYSPSLQLIGEIVTKPATAKYDFMWFGVDQAYNACKSIP